MSLTSDIKEYALNIGFCKVGITSADPFDTFLRELTTRGGKYDYWMEKFTKGAAPRKIMPNAKSVIVLAYDYAQKSFPETLLPMIGRIYLSRCYLPLENSLCGSRLKLFHDFLSKNGCSFTVDMNTLMMRPAAARAGVSTFGRNNFAYVDGIGSFVVLYGFLVDQELELDTPKLESKCPEGCHACQTACPTKALYAPYKIDPSKCIGFNNWMRQKSKCDSEIPREIRPKLGQHIHGCDLCQVVCPHNRAKVNSNFPRDEFLDWLAERFSLTDLLHMPDGFYQSRVYPIMYNYISDQQYFQRNAAIAIGNSHNEAYIPELVKELSNPHETVRLYVAWALGEMKHRRAQSFLKDHISSECSDLVQEEIRAALDNQS